MSRFLLNPLLLAALVTLLPGRLAHAGEDSGLTASTTIFAQATLTYDGGRATASVSVRVALVAATPNLVKAGIDPTGIVSGMEGSLLFRLSAMANGLDSYRITATSEDAGVNPPTINFYAGVSGTNPLTATRHDLSAVIAASDKMNDNQFEIPGDTNANISPGDILLIGTHTYMVESVGEGNAAGEGTAEIRHLVTLAQGGYNQDDASFTNLEITEGDQIGEVAEFRVVVTAGTGTGTHTITVTVDHPDDSGRFTAATQEFTVGVVAPPSASITKRVCVLSAESDGVAYCNDDGNGGDRWSDSSDEAEVGPGNFLLYEIIAEPPGNTAIMNCALVDEIPSYTTYVANSLMVNGVLVSSLSQFSGNDADTFPLSASYSGNQIDGTDQRPAGGLIINSPSNPPNLAFTDAFGGGSPGVIAEGTMATIHYKVQVD